MRILGVDPGYDRLGLAVVTRTPGREELLYSDCILTDKTLSFPERLNIAGGAVEDVVAQYAPDEAALEKTFFSKNQKTAIAVSEARGAILYILSTHTIPVYEYGPQEVKLAVTGYGNSDKKQISAMLPKLITLPKTIQYDDEYDAIAVALTHAAGHSSSLLH